MEHEELDGRKEEVVRLRAATPGTTRPLFDFARCKAEFERAYLVRLVKHTRGNVTVAAKLAGLDRSHLYRLLRKHRITPDGEPISPK